jgi:glycosyltransferase involved in cell wall biosynthesis
MNSLSDYIRSLHPGKVALITSMYPPYPAQVQQRWGGVEIDLEDLVTSLTKEGIPVHIVSFDYILPIKDKNDPIQRVGRYTPYVLMANRRSLFEFVYKEFFRPLIFLRLIRLLKAEKPDIVVIGKTYQFSFALYIACLVLDLPYIVRYDWTCPAYPKEEPCTIGNAFDCPDCIETIMGIKIPNLFKRSAPFYFVPLFFLKRYFWNKSTKVSVVSEHYKPRIESFGVHPDKIEINPPKSTLLFDENEIQRLTLLYKKENECILLFVGRIELEKGILLLLDALAQPILQKDHFKILIVGTGSQAPVVAMASQRDERIVYVGAIPHSKVGNYYAIADLVVIPSIVPESYGLVATEAMSLNKPVIGFNFGGLKEILSNYKDGILVKEISDESFAREICHFIDSFLKIS